MELLTSYTLELLAFALLSLLIVLRHNHLQRNLRKLERRHVDAPLAWWIEPVPKGDAHSSDGAGPQH